MENENQVQENVEKKTFTAEKKRNIIIVLSVVIVLLGVFIVINLKGNNEQAGNNNETSNSTEKTENAKPEEILVGSDTLVVYYSHTGTTEKAALKIRELLNADLVELEPVTTYPTDYNAHVEVVQNEQNDNARPPLKTTVNDFDKYKTIFVGYPIWIGIQPMLIDTFLESYNFDGKTVVLFATSGSTAITDSETDIKKLLPKSTFKESLLIKNIDDIEPWLKKIGML